MNSSVYLNCYSMQIMLNKHYLLSNNPLYVVKSCQKSSCSSQYLSIDWNILFVTFGMHSGLSFQKQYSGSFMPYITSFAMQRLHNAYTEEYQWFYYMLNAILTMQLRWVRWGKVIAEQKEVVRVIMVLLIPLSKLFHCEIRMYVVCCPFCCQNNNRHVNVIAKVWWPCCCSSLCDEYFCHVLLSMYPWFLVVQSIIEQM